MFHYFTITLYVHFIIKFWGGEINLRGGNSCVPPCPAQINPQFQTLPTRTDLSMERR